MSKECYQRMIEEKKRVLRDRPLNVTETDGVQQVHECGSVYYNNSCMVFCSQLHGDKTDQGNHHTSNGKTCMHINILVTV